MAVFIKESNTNTNKESTFLKVFPKGQRVLISSIKDYKKKTDNFDKKIIATDSLMGGLFLLDPIRQIKGKGGFYCCPSEAFEKINSYYWIFEKENFLFFMEENEVFPFFLREIKNLRKSYKSLNKDINSLKGEAQELKNSLKELKERRKEENKAIKAENKALKAEFKEIKKKTPKEAQKFLQEPEYKKEIEETSEERILAIKIEKNREKFSSKEASLRVIRRDINSRGYKAFFSRYEIVFGKYENTTIYTVRKRKRILRASVDSITEDIFIKIENFKEFIENIIEEDKNRTDIENIEVSFPLYDSRILSLVCENEVSDSLIENAFSLEEVSARKEKPFIPLAPIDPMQAASIIGGGIGSFSKKLNIKGEIVIMKGAVVKEFSTLERKTLKGTEKRTVETQVPKIGLYYLDRKEAELLG